MAYIPFFQKHGYNVTKKDESNPIGEGAYGKVFKGVDIHTKQEVAIKMMNKSRMDETQLATETSLLKTLSQENKCISKGVICLLKVFEGKQNYFIVMPLLKGPSLWEWLNDIYFKKKRRISDKDEWFQAYKSGLLTPARMTYDILNLMLELAQTLEELHERGIAHFDIKPENIMFNTDSNGCFIESKEEEKDCHLVFVDFGIGCHFKEEKQKDNFVCTDTTIFFKPAELFNGTYHISEAYKVDIYALGITFHEMAAYTNPYDHLMTSKLKDKNEKKIENYALLEKAVTDLENPWAEVDTGLMDLDRLIYYMIMQDKSLRWSMRKVIEELQSIIDNYKKKEKKPVLNVLKPLFIAMRKAEATSKGVRKYK